MLKSMTLSQTRQHCCLLHQQICWTYKGIKRLGSKNVHWKPWPIQATTAVLMHMSISGHQIPYAIPVTPITRGPHLNQPASSRKNCYLAPVLPVSEKVSWSK